MQLLLILQLTCTSSSVNILECEDKNVTIYEKKSPIIEFLISLTPSTSYPSELFAVEILLWNWPFLTFLPRLGRSSFINVFITNIFS